MQGCQCRRYCTQAGLDRITVLLSVSQDSDYYLDRNNNRDRRRAIIINNVWTTAASFALKATRMLNFGLPAHIHVYLHPHD